MFALDKATELSVACKAKAAAADDSKDSIRTARHLTIEPGLSLMPSFCVKYEKFVY